MTQTEEDHQLPAASPQKVVIYGTRGHARGLHQVIEDLAATGADITCIGFLVDKDFQEDAVIHDLPVLGDADWLASAPDVLVTIGIGATRPRHRIAVDIERRFGPRFPTLRHPRAWVGKRVTIGPGSNVCAGAMVTTEVTIGRHVQLLVNCTVEHDAVIGDFVTVAPGANVLGRVTVGEGTFVGAGASILTDVKVGAWVNVGAGAVVTRDVPDGVTVVGVPARIVE
jgi:sugar O-acyltransferase (sialic acid O-acetyltransferase NeuD family)